MKSHIAITFDLELDEGWNECWWDDFQSKVGGAIVNFTYPRNLSFEHDETGETLAEAEKMSEALNSVFLAISDLPRDKQLTIIRCAGLMCAQEKK